MPTGWRWWPWRSPARPSFVPWCEGNGASSGDASCDLSRRLGRGLRGLLLPHLRTTCFDPLADRFHLRLRCHGRVFAGFDRRRRGRLVRCGVRLAVGGVAVLRGVIAGARRGAAGTGRIGRRGIGGGTGTPTGCGRFAPAAALPTAVGGWPPWPSNTRSVTSRRPSGPFDHRTARIQRCRRRQPDASPARRRASRAPLRRRRPAAGSPSAAAA